MIQQLQASLAQERERAGSVERELRQEVEKVGSLNREQQAVMQTNMNKAPSNQTEAYMQHELTRLTGENFDLREKIENLNDTVKRLKKQLRMYMKKLAEVGGGSVAELEREEQRRRGAPARSTATTVCCSTASRTRSRRSC